MKHDTLEYVNKSSYLLVLRPEGSPLADAVSLVENDANDLVCESLRFEELRKPELALLQEYLWVCNDNTVFAILNVLSSWFSCLSLQINK